MDCDEHSITEYKVNRTVPQNGTRIIRNCDLNNGDVIFALAVAIAISITFSFPTVWLLFCIVAFQKQHTFIEYL